MNSILTHEIYCEKCGASSFLPHIPDWCPKCFAEQPNLNVWEFDGSRKTIKIGKGKQVKIANNPDLNWKQRPLT